MRLSGTVRVESIYDTDLIGTYYGSEFQFVIPSGLREAFKSVHIGDRIKILSHSKNDKTEISDEYFYWEIILAWKYSGSRWILLQTTEGKRLPKSAVACFATKGSETREYKTLHEAAADQKATLRAVSYRVHNGVTDKHGWTWGVL